MLLIQTGATVARAWELRAGTHIAMIDLARKILLYDKLRFLITVCGVGFSVALVLVQTGLFLGLLDNASTTIDHMDADVWVAAKNTPNIDFARTFPDTYVYRVRAIHGVARADNL